MLKFTSICPHPPLLIPSIGQDSLLKISSTVEAMKKLGGEIKNSEISTIVIISPHGPVQRDFMSITGSDSLGGNFLQFGDKTSMKFENNLDLGLSIKRVAKKIKVPAEVINGDISLDHGAMVPLYFLTEYNPKIKIVPIAFSYLDHQSHFKFGEAISEVIESTDEKIALVASGDLSHCLIPGAPAAYSPNGKKFDNLLLKLLESNEVGEILNMDSGLIEEAAECGLRSIIILLGALANTEYKFEKLSYEGPFGVGYLVGRFVIV